MERADTEFSFFGIGTAWSVVTDGSVLRKDARSAVLAFVDGFDKRLSRFIASSEANAFRNADAGDYSISKEFAVLLAKADDLRKLTDGVYDPAVGGLLERAGYDATYRMEPLPNTEEFVLPTWTLTAQTLTLDGPAVFDIGGMGKGYCIDRVADIVRSFGYEHFLVDGGGDMFATKKASGAPWRVAIEYPGKPDMAAGLVELKDQGLAVSDGFRRRWGKWHHLVDPQLKKPIEHVAGAAAVAPSAWDADCVTSALFFAASERYPAVSEYYKASYLVFQSDGMTSVSPNWKGELY